MAADQRRLLKALRCEPVDVTPIWIMRQAGRYLPEYRELRQDAGSFLNLCRNPDLACEATLQPLRRYDLDAGIIFSDILVVPDALGLELTVEEGEGPRLHKPTATPEAIAKLEPLDPEESLDYVMAAIRKVVDAWGPDGTPLLGFSGSPWTLACYMVEGRGTGDFRATRALCYRDPVSIQRLLDVLVESIARYLAAQVKAGVSAVMIFDTWGGVLSKRGYLQFSLDPITRTIARFRELSGLTNFPVIAFSKGGGQWLEEQAKSGAQGLGLDWSVDIAEAHRRLPATIALQGNLDPAVLTATPSVVVNEAQQVLASVAGRPGHVFNLGHGVTPEVDPDNVAALVDAVHAFSVA